VSVVIERIETAGPDRRARRLVFSDPSLEPRLTSEAAVRCLGLEEGALVDSDELEGLLATCEPACARERALRILGHRERSARELARRLHDDGYPAAVVAEVVERFTELELVDDARFAELWIRTRTTAGFGPQRIRRELREKGIPDDIVAAYLEQSQDSDLVANARSMLSSAPLDTKAERERALRKLVRKGFDFSTALKAIGGEVEDR
jgi:regulatory protein